jgi:hypothetical protein
VAGGLLSDGASASVVDVRAMLDSGLPDAIAGLLEMGLLVSIGTTRDRGALSLTITSDGDWAREYFRRSDEALDWLRHAAGVLRERGLGDPGAEAPATPKPTRGRRRAL